MPNLDHTHCTAFEGSRCVAAGELAQVVQKVKKILDRGECTPILIFDNSTSEPIEVDFRGTVKDVLARLPSRASAHETSTDPIEAAATDPTAASPRGPGRPKLGVVAREVTLLPRHWEWLNRQPGGASVALRKLVEDARRTNAGKDRVRQSQDATYRFMSAMAGNNPGFEEAARALFAMDAKRFGQHMASWPADIRDHAKKLAADALGNAS